MGELDRQSARRPTTMVGMSNPRTAAGKACQWCGEPAATIVTVRPARVSRDKEVIENAITAAACRAHADQAQAEQPEHVDSLRRKHARDVPQLGLFEVEQRPRSAVHG